MYHRQATISLHHAAPADAFALSVICVGSRHAVVVSLAKKKNVVSFVAMYPNALFTPLHVALENAVIRTKPYYISSNMVQ